MDTGNDIPRLIFPSRHHIHLLKNIFLECSISQEFQIDSHSK